MAILDDVKLALRINTNAFNSELNNLIDAACKDLGLAGIDLETVGAQYLNDPLINHAICTYCKLNFGELDKAAYDYLKASYDEQKKQMGMASGYTVFGPLGG